jgi:parallel beta-helix repeat protein
MKKRKIITIIMLLMIVNMAIKVKVEGKTIEEKELRYTDHEPIKIRGNEQIEQYATEGEGTEEKPYVIKGLHIKMGVEDSNDTGIYLSEVTDYLVIKECYFEGMKTDLDGSSEGIDMYRSENIVIEKNKFTIVYTGIYLSRCSKVEIRDNEFVNLWRAVNIQNETEDVTIEGNKVTNCYSLGSIYENINNKRISYINNEVENCVRGISISLANEIDIIGNIFKGINETVIRLYNYHGTGPNNVNISMNYFVGCKEEGILVRGENHNHEISYNLFSGLGSYSIDLRASVSGVMIHHNSFINKNCSDYARDFSYDLTGNGSNTWYNPVSLEGNYWDDYNGTGEPYIIDTLSTAIQDYFIVDLYPLKESPVSTKIPEKETSFNLQRILPAGIIVLTMVIGAGIMVIMRRK